MEDNYEVETSKNGTTRHYKNGKKHREDGPAVEYIDGTKEWRINGKLHRDDGPAFIYYDGTKSWFVKGKRHRDDGPAIMGSHGFFWLINDVNITEEVEEWMYLNNIPYYAEWTNKEIAMFKLKFL